jgi:hypothetical protein
VRRSEVEPTNIKMSMVKSDASLHERYHHALAMDKEG